MENLKYSPGFERWLKISRKQKLNAFTALYLAGFRAIPANNIELQNRLAAMTETEFKNFKKSN